MWKTTNRFKLTCSRFTSSVNGLYQHEGPQGIIARVGRPAPVVGGDLIHEFARHKAAHLGRVPAEAERERRRRRCRSSSVHGTSALTRTALRIIPFASPIVISLSLNFTILDWSIILLYLALSMAAGLYGKRFVSGPSDFLVAGRGIGLYLGISTLAATEIGTVTFMYYAELGYKAGFAAFVNGLIAGSVMILIGRTGFIITRLREMQLMTIPEFFERRYSRNLRVLTGVLVATGGILNMGVFLKIEGTFLAIISGIPIEYLKVVMTAILLLELLYTVLGGMVSVVITDFIQFVALSLGALIVTGICIHAAGWQSMHDAVFRNMGPSGFDPIASPQFGLAFIAFQLSSGWRSTPAGRRPPCAPFRRATLRSAGRSSPGPALSFSAAACCRCCGASRPSPCSVPDRIR